MTGMQASNAVEFWLKRTGHRPADAPGAAPPRAEPTAGAVATAKPIDYREAISLRNEMALNLASTLRQAAGTFDELGENHPMLAGSDTFVPRLPSGIGESLLANIYG